MADILNSLIGGLFRYYWQCGSRFCADQYISGFLSIVHRLFGVPIQTIMERSMKEIMLFYGSFHI